MAEMSDLRGPGIRDLFTFRIMLSLEVADKLGLLLIVDLKLVPKLIIFSWSLHPYHFIPAGHEYITSLSTLILLLRR